MKGNFSILIFVNMIMTKDSKGYSLFEFSVTLGLVALVSLSARLGVQNIEKQGRFEQEIAYFERSLERALHRSLLSGDKLTISLKRRGYTIMRADGEEYHHLFPEGIEALESSDLVFYPTGVNSPKRLVLRSSDGRTCALILSLRGRLRRECMKGELR